MRKIVIYGFIVLVVLFLSIVIVRQNKITPRVDIIRYIDTTLYVDNREIDILSDSSNIKDMPVLKFAKTRYDFGTIKKHTPIIVSFEFINKGNIPLVIQKVDVSCGCLSIEYPKQPTMPDKKAIVEVKINTQTSGDFNKPIFVKSNAIEDIVVLRIVGQVK